MEMTFLHWVFAGYTAFIGVLGVLYFVNWPRPSTPDHRGQVFGLLFSIETALVGAVLQEARVQEKEEVVQETVQVAQQRGEVVDSLSDRLIAVNRVLQRYTPVDVGTLAGDSAPQVSFNLPAAVLDTLTAATNIPPNLRLHAMEGARLDVSE